MMGAWDLVACRTRRPTASCWPSAARSCGPGHACRSAALECLPAEGPALIVADHDSYWDPIAIAVATRKVRPIRALAKSTLWKTRVTAAFMNGMGHIPVERGASNLEAMATAIDELRKGACIGVFPEGTRSLGRELRARTGIGRLAEAVPEAVVVCARTNGSVDVVRFPKRPRISVEFFRPAGGPKQPGESAHRLQPAPARRAARGRPARDPGPAPHRGQAPGGGREGGGSGGREVGRAARRGRRPATGADG